MSTKLQAAYDTAGNVQLLVVIGSTSHIISWESGRIAAREAIGTEGSIPEIPGCDPVKLLASIYRLSQIWETDEEAAKLLNSAAILSQINNLFNFKMETIMTAAKKSNGAKAPAKKAAAKKAPPAKKAPAKKAVGDEAPVKKSRVSVSSRIRELILEGVLTDDKIFAKVQKEFDLDDKKRSYIAWNRSDLRRKGRNPPEAVAE